MTDIQYAELSVTTNFSFLRSGSSPEELVEQAQHLGLSALGIADRNSVAGVVRAYAIAREKGFRILPGARLVFADGTPDILAFPQNRTAWGQLCRLLTLGKHRAEKGSCILMLADLVAHVGNMSLIVCTQEIGSTQSMLDVLATLKACHDHVWLSASMLYRGDDGRRLARLQHIAGEAGVPLIATNDVLYHVAERRPLQDVLTCIREHLTLEKAGRRLEANAERHLKGAEEMRRFFHKIPQAVSETQRFVASCSFSLKELKYDYPHELREGHATPHEALVSRAREGLRSRYPDSVLPKVIELLERELELIGRLGYASYFLTVHDIVLFARGKGILCQGRGSAANSVICYCLGITEVNPAEMDFLFERFVSEERGEPPDIDVDFEHERREEVIQHIYERYGRDKAGLTATVICYRGRSAIRDVGKVFGLSQDVISALSGTLWGWSSHTARDDDVRTIGLDPDDPNLKRALALADELIDFPRHLSQHVGGFVITRDRLDEMVPVENAAMADRTVIEWNKDDLDVLDILKVDVLALGMLSCLRRAFVLLEAHYGRKLALGTIPKADASLYTMLCRADSIGVFQVESRAQMSMLPRLRPEKFYDLVIEVAIVRPGPIQGDMVNPYLRRKQRLEPVRFPSPSPEFGAADELSQILSKTLGVPLFQEQAMRIAIVAAGFAPHEADKLRRAMATFKRMGTIQHSRDKFVNGMVRRGYEREFAESCFRQIEGFGEYGFPESHAASFAILVYASAWFKCHYPDIFAVALLNSQPMGFYAPAQILRDAKEHGVELREIDINYSCWDNVLEEDEVRAAQRLHPRHVQMQEDVLTTKAVRLGFREIKELSEKDGLLVEDKRGGGYDSIRDLWLRTRLEPASLERLAMGDAFGSLGLDRREALWVVRALRRAGDKEDLPLLASLSYRPLEEDVALPPMLPGEQVIEDYRHLSFSLKAHPVSFLRADFADRGITCHKTLSDMKSGCHVRIAGLVLVRQRPGTSKGVIFMTLEDETGIANVIVWPKVFEIYRPVVLGARLLGVSGKLQSESGVVHLIADHLEDLTPYLKRLTSAPAWPASHSAEDVNSVMPRGRNFH
jgi:error-prone DNA polymerase